MRLFRLRLLAVMALTATTLLSCEKPVPIDDGMQDQVAVTYSSIEGCWRLTHLNGEVLHDGTELFIEFSNKQLNDGMQAHRYKLLDNIGSMYPRLTTGSFTITEQKEEYILSGNYDNGVGDWNEEYRIVMLPGERMQWWSRTTSTSLQFVYAMEIPEEFYK
ncbi:MAG: lipocalin family protein [Alistipes sp.]|nr:lipocalin family protein [Alistipes sp.]MBQ6940560.1 lipocalin family protein [Alistipes sp.]